MIINIENNEFSFEVRNKKKNFKFNLTPKLIKFIKETFILKLLIISGETVYCTNCGKTFSIDEIYKNVHTTKLQNEEAICPICNESGICKYKNVGRKKLSHAETIVHFVNINKIVCALTYRADIHYTKLEPEVDLWLGEVNMFSYKNETIRLMNAYDYNSRNFAFHKVNKIGVKNLTANTFYGNHKRVYKFIENNQILNNTDYKYIKDYFFEKVIEGKEPDYLCRLLDLFTKYPVAEKFIKSGLSWIVDAKVVRGTTPRGAINWRKNNICDALKLNRRDIRDLKKYKKYGHNSDLYVIAYYKKYFRKENIMLRDLLGRGIYNLGDINKVSEENNIPRKRILKYLDKQEAEGVFSPAGIYKDYISECNSLGYDLLNKNIVFPKNLLSAHDKTSKLIKIKKDEIKDKKIRLLKKEFKNLEYSNEKFSIILPKSCKEIIKEGEKLSHCVASYIDKINKTRLVFFIRENKNKEKSFYTLEARIKEQLTIMQIRGQYNKSATDEVNKFVDEWKEIHTKGEKNHARKNVI